MKKQSVYNPTPPRGALIQYLIKDKQTKEKNSLIVVERSKTGKKYSVKVKKGKEYTPTVILLSQVQPVVLMIQYFIFAC